MAVAKLKLANAELGLVHAKLSPTLDGLQFAQKAIDTAESKLSRDSDMLKWFAGQREKAESTFKEKENELNAAKAKLKDACDLEVQANFAAFAKVQPEMKFVKDATELFHILEVPKNLTSPDIGPTFPFCGKGYRLDVRQLLLRESHYDLYKMILLQLGVCKLFHAGYREENLEDKLGKKFIVCGPPGTGKSVMLNLIWYVARFELGMDVICHMPNNAIYLYPHGSGTVELLDMAGAKNLLGKCNTVYLFDPDDKGAFEPIYNMRQTGTSVIATSPNIQHYRNFLKSNLHLPKEPSVVPVWSYAWTPQEITAGLELLGYAEVKSASNATLGNFRFALNAATHPNLYNEATATDKLQDEIGSMSADDLEQFVNVPSANALAEMFTTGSVLSAFRLSHSIVTQQAPELATNASKTIAGYRAELEQEPVRTLPELIEVLKNANVEVPTTVTYFTRAMETARLYHSKFSITMANENAARLLFDRAVRVGLGGMMLDFLTRLPVGARGSVMEDAFLTGHHPYPYRIFKSNGALTPDTIDLSKMHRSRSGALTNVTRFHVQSADKPSPESPNPNDEPPYQLVADKVYEAHTQGTGCKSMLAL